MKHTLALLATLLLAPSALHADELRFARIFTDHGVLQREISVPVWGWGMPGAKVAVSFAGQTKTAIANERGKWLVRLDPMQANADGQELKVTSGDASATLTDTLVGEVWLTRVSVEHGLQHSQIDARRRGSQAHPASDSASLQSRSLPC